MKQVLLTNDDGVKSSGFYPLLQELSKEFQVTAIVPNSERSWVAKAITTRRELKLKKVKFNGFEFFTIDGTPADCVTLGLHNVLDVFPDVVVSGINLGENVGHARILSSGTIGAAMEAAFEKVPALASSLSIPLDLKKNLDLYHEKNFSLFYCAAQITRKLSHLLLETSFPQGVDLFSMNIPFDATVDTRVMITKPFRASYGKLFHETSTGLLHTTPPLDFGSNQENGTDFDALIKKCISLTPMNLDLVKAESLKQVDGWIQKVW